MIGNFAKVLVLVCALMVTAQNATQAQQATPPEAVAPSSFDQYRAMAVTAGIIGGALVATVVTDGLVIPVYAWATGAEAGGMLAGVRLPGFGETLRSMGIWGERVTAGARYQMGDTIKMLGAVGGGFLADGWYLTE